MNKLIERSTILTNLLRAYDTVEINKLDRDKLSIRKALKMAKKNKKKQSLKKLTGEEVGRLLIKTL